MSNIIKYISTDLVGRGVGKLSNYLLTFLIATVLGAESLGEFAFALVVLRIGSAFARTGLDTAMQKFIPMYRHDENKLTGTIFVGLSFPLISGTLVSLFVYGLLTSRYFGLSGSLPIFVMLWLVPVYSTFKVIDGTLKGFKKIEWAVYVRELVHKALLLMLAVVLLVALPSIESVLLAFVASVVLALLVGLYYIAKVGGFGGIRAPDVDFRSILSYTAPVFLVSVSQPVLQWVDVITLRLLTTTQVVGVYEAAYQTSLLPLFLITAINSIFPTLASEYHDDDRMEDLFGIYRSLTKWLIAAMLFMASYLLLFSNDIMALFGPEFEEGALVLVVLIIAQSITIGVGPAGHILTMTGHERVEMLNTILITGVNVILNYTLILKFGITGAGLATGISLVLRNLLRLSQIYYIYDRIPVDYKPYSVIASFTVPLLLMIGIWFTGFSRIVSLVLGLLLPGAMYLSLLYVISYTESDKRLLEPL